MCWNLFRFIYKEVTLFFEQQLMTRADFSISFKWPATAWWKMWICELWASLLSLWELIDIVNNKVNWDTAKTTVEINAVREWSFEVWLSIIQDLAIWTIITIWVNSQEFINLIFWEFWIIYWWKLLSWRKLNKISNNKDDTCNVTLNDWSILNNMPRKITNIFWSTTINNTILNVCKPLGNEWIDEIRFKQAGTNLNSVKKDEYQCIKVNVQDNNLEEIDTISSEAILTLDTVWLYSNKWKFSRWENKIRIEIKDKNFLDKVKSWDLEFRQWDYIRAKIIDKYFNEDWKIKTETEIEEVIELKHQPVQPSLLAES